MLYVVAPWKGAISTIAPLLYAAALTTACTDYILLGNECRSDRSNCQPVPGPSAESERTEAGVRIVDVPPLVMVSLDAGMVPSSMPVEGAPDAEISLGFELLGLQNPSFEREGGIGGDVVLSDAVSTLVPVAPVDTIFAELPHWYACIPLSVSSLTWQNNGDAGTTRSVYGDYLSFVVNGTTVRQALAQPLQAGSKYSFEAEVITRGEGLMNVHLDAQGAQSSCGAGSLLGRSAVLPSAQEWTRICVTFTADKSYPYLLLAPSVDGAAPPASARFYLDDLHQVASCTP